MSKLERHPLDYQTPPPPAPKDGVSVGRLFGAVVSAIGVMFTWAGVKESLYIFHGLTSFLRSDHALISPISLLIGLVCLLFGGRWLREKHDE